MLIGNKTSGGSSREGGAAACVFEGLHVGAWSLKGDAPDQFGCHEDAHLLEGGDDTRGAPRSKTPVYRLASSKT